MRKLSLAIAAVVVLVPAAFAASSPVVKAHKGKLGTFLVNSKGHTLYLFEADTSKKSACNGACAKAWAPLLTTSKPSAGAGLTASKLSTIKRKDGTTQVTYGGHPLYTYDDDHKAGQTEGEGSKEFGDEWYVVAPSGKKIDESR